MSRTRGHSDPNRPATDFYETPEWCTKAVVGWLRERHFDLGDFNGVKPPAMILDPGAGTGAITRILHQEWPEAYIEAVEIDGEKSQRIVLEQAGPRFSVQTTDFWRPGYFMPRIFADGRYDLCVCNPPFSGSNREDLALAFIRQAMHWSRVGAFLTRLNWLAAAPTKAKRERYEYLKAHPPCVLVMGKRPIFRGEHGDSCEYCWLVWGVPGTEGRWEMLNCGWEERP